VNPVFAITPLRAATLLLALTMVGCTSVNVSGDKIDYRSKANKTDPLDIPPDLTQLVRDGRYQAQAGVVSASGLKQGTSAGSAAVAAAPATVAVLATPDMHIERQGNSRWLVSTLPPEKIYPLLRKFWLDRGFQLDEDNAEIGVMETNWAENRAKIPLDIIRSTIGRAFDNLYSSGERDRFRSRVERSATGSEVYISHRGMSEVYMPGQRDTTTTVWQARPTDPGLEAEFLARFMVALGAKDEVARSAVAAASTAPAKARVATVASSATMEIDDSFDRAWRQVGLALDRGGFTVEDRDRSAGLYFVRYVDPKLANKEEPNFFQKLFSGDKNAARPQRLRVLVKAVGSKSLVSIQNSAGVADDSTVARQIIGKLTDELR
jgi:outer membrane protein assembly factor BamC